MAKHPLSSRQVLALQVSERTMSVLSIIGSLFIMGTFLKWHYFRKPINRLVFYASWGNVMANVATLISTSALPERGAEPSPLCEFQGILIQWFMMADSLWVFCMALNVLLVFQSSCDIRRLRGLEKWYLLFAYGLPFVPCVVYIIVDHHGNKRIIGGATIWCWIDKRVEWMRIAFFYAPVWIVICSTLSIYIYVGRTIFKQRAELRSFSNHARNDSIPVITNPFMLSDTNNIVKKVDMRVTTETIDSDQTAIAPEYGNESRDSFSSTRNLSSVVQIQGPLSIHQDEGPVRGYRVTVSAAKDLEAARRRTISSNHTNQPRRNAMDGNTAAWSYLKVAFLMFAALFIVWVPSTVNRLQQFIHKDSPVFGLNLASALVLPLQGFWNAMVYTSTTWPECKRALGEILEAVAKRRRAEPHQPQQQQQQQQANEKTSTAPTDLDAEIPLKEMLNSDPTSLHSCVSSTESMKSPSPSRLGTR